MTDMAIPQVQVSSIYQKEYGVEEISQELVLEVRDYIMAAVRGGIHDYCAEKSILVADFMAKLKDSVDLRSELRPYVEAQLRKSKLVGARFIKNLYKHDRNMFGKFVDSANHVTIKMREKDSWVKGAYVIAEDCVCYAKSKRPVFYDNFCDGLYTHKYKDKFCMDSEFRKYKRGANKSRINKVRAGLAEAREHFGYVLSRRKEGAAPKIKTEAPRARTTVGANGPEPLANCSGTGQAVRPKEVKTGAMTKILRFLKIK